MRNKAFLFFMLFLLLISAACVPANAPASRTLTILAAASLTEAFTELGEMFETRNPDVTVVFNFAGSQQLAQQLDQGVRADIFASANVKYMDAAVASGRVTQDGARIFVTNRLVVIVPKGNPAGLRTLNDLARVGLKLDLADASVPVGQYALDFLDKASQNEKFGPVFNEDVLKNVVSYENNVKAVVTKVALGEADAGIVYVSDITTDLSGQLERLDIPDSLNTIAPYPIAMIKDSQNPDLATAFISLVLSVEGQ